MRVTSFGLFWRLNEVEWNPGKGNKTAFRLLGRVGFNKTTLKLCDFRHQRGLYILYNQYGASYVGISRKRGFGTRLKEHLTDHLQGKWDRFSWFGFRDVYSASGLGFHTLRDSDLEITDRQETTIADLEALLIRAIGPRDNTAWMKFAQAEEWTQIVQEETEKYLTRVASSDAVDDES